MSTLHGLRRFFHNHELINWDWKIAVRGLENSGSEILLRAVFVLLWNGYGLFLYEQVAKRIANIIDKTTMELFIEVSYVREDY